MLTARIFRLVSDTSTDCMQLVKVDEIETALNVYIPAQAEMPPPEWSLKTQMLSGCMQQLMTELSQEHVEY